MLPSGAPSPAAHIMRAGPASVRSNVLTWYLLNGESAFWLFFGLSNGLPAPPLAFSAVVGKDTDLRESQVVLLIECYRKECGIYTLHSPLALSYFLFMAVWVCFFSYTVEK